jgi:hypothetical protein
LSGRSNSYAYSGANSYSDANGDACPDGHSHTDRNTCANCDCHSHRVGNTDAESGQRFASSQSVHPDAG